ncbi:hypothetical protein PR003_g21897 [Phytophthora rubi]|uniref:Uncharacterized protein n=1 Tax=Phytophthora rubi TaxID=129364 RepID=A0A6A3JFT7_9STRA|nr:hypothetical protein PR001_g20610 [Phytophthora rubi]KAE9303868.1 hypothetical protein PR003_g21897 [Phytophthora rubi]
MYFAAIESAYSNEKKKPQTLAGATDNRPIAASSSSSLPRDPKRKRVAVTGRGSRRIESRIEAPADTDRDLNGTKNIIIKNCSIGRGAAFIGVLLFERCELHSEGPKAL